MENNKTKLKKILSNVSKDSCPNSLNFHMHTMHSDGSLTPIQLVEQANKIGLNDFAVTDHHNVYAYHIISEWIKRQNDIGLSTPTIWSGIEISATLKGCLIHILGLGFRSDDPVIRKYTLGEALHGDSLRAENVVKTIQDSGGFAILAHPARYRKGFSELIDAAFDLGFDGGEAWYDYDMNTSWIATPIICDLVDQRLESYGMLRTCGTDTHGISLNGR